MIRLRRDIDRVLAHRWLRILLIVFLVGLLVLVAFHVASDGVHEDDAAMCVAFLVLGFILLVPRPPRLVLRLRSESPRGPPAPRAVASRFLAPRALAIPLRL